MCCQPTYLILCFFCFINTPISLPKRNEDGKQFCIDDWKTWVQLIALAAPLQSVSYPVEDVLEPSACWAVVIFLLVIIIYYYYYYYYCYCYCYCCCCCYCYCCIVVLYMQRYYKFSSYGMRCCRSDWPGLFLFCCYQPSCVVSQQSWFGFFFV